MNPSHAYNLRAALVHVLRTKSGLTLAEVASVLRLPSKEAVRKLEGPARRLVRMKPEKFRELIGLGS